MLQIDLQPYASDALEDAMNLAQIKALNSFTFSDCLNYLNYAWSDIYSRMANIDDGYYAKTLRLTSKKITLPKYVKNSIKVFRAQSPEGYNRQVYREAGDSDIRASGTYYMKGFDLYCEDAERTSIWLRYIPACPMLFFTHHNRDPKRYEYGSEWDRPVECNDYHIYTLEKETDVDEYVTAAKLVHKQHTTAIDIYKGLFGQTLSNGETITEEDWNIKRIICDYPYIFVTYKHKYITNYYVSGFFDNGVIQSRFDFVEYNPYAYTGKNSNIEYLKCKYNDKTGMGVIVRDWNEKDDNGNDYTVKELGWTPDSLLQYPKPEMYRYLVARLADKFSAMNESNVMGVQKELIEAKYAFESCLETDKAAFKRITNVNARSYDDWL